MLPATFCGKCGYVLDSLKPDTKGTVLCPECGTRGLPSPAKLGGYQRELWRIPFVAQLPLLGALLFMLVPDNWIGVLFVLPAAFLWSLLLTIIRGYRLRRKLRSSRAQYAIVIVLGVLLSLTITYVCFLVCVSTLSMR